MPYTHNRAQSNRTCSDGYDSEPDEDVGLRTTDVHAKDPSSSKLDLVKQYLAVCSGFDRE